MKFDISNKAKAYMQIAECYYLSGEFETRKEYVKRAYEIGSNDTEVQKTIYEAYTDIERGKYDK